MYRDMIYMTMPIDPTSVVLPHVSFLGRDYGRVEVAHVKLTHGYLGTGGGGGTAGATF